MRPGFRFCIALFALVSITACDRAEPERSNDTPVVVLPPPSDSVDSNAVAVSPWNAAAGPAFLVIGANSTQAAVILGSLDSSVELDSTRLDLASIRNANFDLLLSGRRVGSARAGAIIPPESADECVAWPHVSIEAPPDSQPGSWTVGVLRGRFTPTEPDSIAGQSRRDSLRLTMELTRIASAAPDDTVESLKGIPYVVRRGYLINVPGNPSLVLAEVTRSLNQEASPTQEHMLLIVEREAASSRYRLAYVERTSGPEEALESTELLTAGVIRGSTQPSILLARYIGDGVTYSLLERLDEGTWRLRWTSAYAGC